MAELPFAQQVVTQRLWEIKIVLLVLIFVYAFFKFSWSIRLFGFASLLVGARRQGTRGSGAARGSTSTASRS